MLGWGYLCKPKIHDQLESNSVAKIHSENTNVELPRFITNKFKISLCCGAMAVDTLDTIAMYPVYQINIKIHFHCINIVLINSVDYIFVFYGVMKFAETNNKYRIVQSQQAFWSGETVMEELTHWPLSFQVLGLFLVLSEIERR